MAVEITEETSLLVESVWTSVLRLDSAHPDDSFFVEGGDSMLGTMLMLSLMEATGLELSLSDLYENPSLGELTTLVATRMAQ